MNICCERHPRYESASQMLESIVERTKRANPNAKCVVNDQVVDLDTYFKIMLFKDRKKAEENRKTKPDSSAVHKMITLLDPNHREFALECGGIFH